MGISKKVLGGMLLLTGSCIGAGMLALPILTGIAGFVPSLLSFFLAWGFMTFTAFLVLEVTYWFKGSANFVSMTEKSLGPWGRNVSAILYLFLFYALLVSYISASGLIFSQIFPSVFAEKTLSFFFTLFFGTCIFWGTRTVDLVNRFLMLALFLSYFFMLFSGLSKVEFSNLLHKAPKYISISLPVLVISFGFHNMIPTLMNYLDHDVKKMRQVVLGGSLCVFIVYLLWAILVMGIIPFSGKEGILAIYEQKKEASSAISQALGGTFISTMTKAFAFFAIITSFLAQALSLMHFIADGFHKKFTIKNKGVLVFLTLFPPLVFAFSYPNVFIQAINFAGGICAVVLFGILPIMMVWKGRYQKKLSSYQVFGGKALLSLAAMFALFIFIQELYHIFY